MRKQEETRGNTKKNKQQKTKEKHEKKREVGQNRTKHDKNPKSFLQKQLIKVQRTRARGQKETG